MGREEKRKYTEIIVMKSKAIKSWGGKAGRAIYSAVIKPTWCGSH
jgi:hypothetical protein